MNKTIVFATSNKGKISTLERTLAFNGITEWRVEGKALDLLEIQSNDLAAISLSKAQQAYAILKSPVLVMDGGFYIDELNGFPGPFGSFMTEQLGVERYANLVGKFDNRACQFRNVVTFMDGENSYKQFFDSSGDLFTLTDKAWPTPHPKQWSDLWRILVPTGLGYTQPLASLTEEDLHEYTKKRATKYSSSLMDFVMYLKEAETTLRKAG